MIVDMEGKKLKTLKGLGAKDSLLAYSYDRNEMYFARRSLSLKLSSFLEETVDLYLYNLVTDERVLIKKHIANHGSGFGVIF